VRLGAVTPTTGDRGRWLQDLGAVAEGEELLMGRSVLAAQEASGRTAPPAGGFDPPLLETVIKPRRRPVPDARCCPTMDSTRESAVLSSSR